MSDVLTSLLVAAVVLLLASLVSVLVTAAAVWWRFRPPPPTGPRRPDGRHDELSYDPDPSRTLRGYEEQR